MSWSYSGDPSTSPKDTVRFYLQDTDPDDPIMTDEDILFLLASDANPMSAAIKGLKTLVTKYAMLADRTIGDTSIKYTQRLRDLSNLVAMLENEVSTGEIVSVATYHSEAPSYVGPKILFRKGMFDNE